MASSVTSLPASVDALVEDVAPSVTNAGAANGTAGGVGEGEEVCVSGKNAGAANTGSFVWDEDDGKAGSPPFACHGLVNHC